MHRFFVASTHLRQSPVVLTGDVAHQMRRVLRLAPGDRVQLLDGDGLGCEAQVIAVTGKDIRLEILSRSLASGEPRTHITLYQAVLKGERFAWALQKATEVGVSTFVPLITERSIIDDLQVVEAKRARWQRIIQEAAEQCGRGRLPQLLPGQLLRQALKNPGWPGALRVIPWEGALQKGDHGVSLASVLINCNLNGGSRIEVFVGPEGGFTDSEIDWARRQDVQPVTLGPRILRAETAGLVASVAILYQAGEL
jgi:16S rRNA (uracil1498-N3)-methyltransferase